jgi:hypothetical protein
MDVSQLPLNQIEATASNVRNLCYVTDRVPLAGSFATIVRGGSLIEFSACLQYIGTGRLPETGQAKRINKRGNGQGPFPLHKAC